MDTVSKEKRSETMRSIKSRNTLFEKKIKKTLRRAGFKFKSNVVNMTGKPDIVFPKQKAVIFLDSCFWHGCKRHCRLPQAHHSYWKTKIDNNKKRDKQVNKIYRKMGWKILRFWEHELKNDSDSILSKIKITKKTIPAGDTR